LFSSYSAPEEIVGLCGTIFGRALSWMEMGHRLTKIYTRTGDAGETGLGDGSRVPKDSRRVRALGDVDELNSAIGLLLAEKLPAGVRLALGGIQHDLFDLGGEVCIPGHASMNESQVSRLEVLLDEYNSDLPPLKEFILPGGTRAASLAHLSRTVCRRAERSLVSLARDEPVGTTARIYLNRLSDLLFVLGRVLNRAGGGSDVLWQRKQTSEKAKGRNKR
jgi:cob(I)alamin adenosyltransferase